MSGKKTWTCVRQRAGPLVKEFRATNPRISKNDTRIERAGKNEILRPPRKHSIGRSSTEKTELMLAQFGYEGIFYTLTFDDDHLPASFQGTVKAWQSILRKLIKWLGRKFDYVYCIEGRHGDHRYHIHAVLRESDFSPADVRALWKHGYVDDEPLLRDPEDVYWRTASYMQKERTDGITIPIGKRVCRWSQSLNASLPPEQRFEAKSGYIRIPKSCMTPKKYDRHKCKNDYGEYRYAWYIKPENETA